MGTITQIKYIEELKTITGLVEETIPSYSLLNAYAQQSIIPIIRKKGITIAIVELTTCGLITDILTGQSGASQYFLLGMIPYSNSMKIKIGFPREEVSYKGYGVVSEQAAAKLARCIRDYSGAEIGIAETGLLISTELNKRKTQKKAGEVYAAIVSEKNETTEKLPVQLNLSRLEMRHEIAFRVLQFLDKSLTSS